MKAKEKNRKSEVPFEPILFAATVPARKPTKKDIADSKEQKDEVIDQETLEILANPEAMKWINAAKKGKLKYKTLDLDDENFGL